MNLFHIQYRLLNSSVKNVQFVYKILAVLIQMNSTAVYCVVQL
jgi:hypothetical protein